MITSSVKMIRIAADSASSNWVSVVAHNSTPMM